MRKEIYILSMEKIRKLGEVEKAVWQLLDKNAEMLRAWNDYGIGAQGSIAAGVAINEKEFPAIAGAIREAGLTTREYVVCYLTERKTIGAVVSKMTGKQKDTRYTSIQRMPLSSSSISMKSERS
jgi:hypothetical protein